MNSREQAAAEMNAAIRELSGHVPFEKFIGAVRELREVAINDACLFEKAVNPNTTFAAIGRIQGMQDILDLVEQAKISPPSDEPPVG